MVKKRLSPCTAHVTNNLDELIIGLAVESKNRNQTDYDTTASNWICETIISLQKDVRTVSGLKEIHMYNNGCSQNTLGSVFGRGLR